jgi:hypothetical protein
VGGIDITTGSLDNADILRSADQRAADLAFVGRACALDRFLAVGVLIGPADSREQTAVCPQQRGETSRQSTIGSMATGLPSSVR